MHIKVGVNKKANVSSYTNSVSHENIKVKKKLNELNFRVTKKAKQNVYTYLVNIYFKTI